MFGNALYYPTIDIKNDAWLKSTELFGDWIETIVPQSKAEWSYENRTTRTLYENNILGSYVVNPWSDEVAGQEDNVRRFIGVREGKRLLHRQSYNRSIAQSIEEKRDLR